MTTAVIDTNKMSKLGLRRKPTYNEIIGMLDENEKLTGKLPNRDATFFKASPEGSYFDGSDAMEQLKEEQGKLLLRQMSDILLRQNVRTAGRTYHTERARQLPTTSPVISQPSAPMDVEEQLPSQATPTMPSSSTQQASQIQAELTQRGDKATKRREETAMNHRGEVFKQSKQTVLDELVYPKGHPQMYSPLGKPPLSEIPKPEMASRPQVYSIATDDEAMPQALPKPPKTKAKASASSSSTQPALPVVQMDTSSSSKRASPETAIEPKGKAGRPKVRFAETREEGTKRDGSSPEETDRYSKKRKKRKEQQKQMAVGAGEEADDEDDTQATGKGVRKSIQKPVLPSKIGIQRLREEFVNANNKGIISKEEYDRFNELYKQFMGAKGNQGKKSKIISDARVIYREVLFNKLKENYKNQ